MPEQIVFPDTNTFLHYSALDQVDWLSILGADAVVIVITPVVIRELNRSKDFPTSTKSRERARTSLRSLSTWSEQPSPIFIRPSVELKLLANEPLIDFRANNLSRDVSDDHLIASILEYKLHAANQICHLITADLGLKLKAKTRGFSVMQLSDELKLPDESLESEKRIKDLESQIRKLQNRIPLLKLLFEDGQNHVSIELKTPEELNPQSLTRSMNDIRSKYSKMERRPKNTTSDMGIAAFAAALATISPDIPTKEMDEYNQQLDKYFDEYEAHIPKLIDFNNLKLRTFELNVIIVNEGTCPAEDIEMLLHFPNGFSLINKGELPDRPKPPGAPQRPVSGLELLKRNLNGLDSHVFLPSLLQPSSRFSLPVVRNVSRPSIRRTKSYDVNVSVSKAKHGLIEHLDPIYVVFDSFKEAKSFAIDYKIHAANIPDVIEGKLSVQVSKEKRD